MDDIKEAVKIIKNGGIIVFPTDTAYGLGVNALDSEAIKKLFELKGRGDKPVHIIVPNIEDAEKYAVVTESACVLAKKFLPGALTLILKRKGTVPGELVVGLPTVGIRIPDEPIALEIARQAGVPITATSANKSGGKTLYSIEEVKASLGGLWSEVDKVVDIGVLPKRPTSTLVDLTQTPPVILRDGPVSREEIAKVLG